MLNLVRGIPTVWGKPIQMAVREGTNDLDVVRAVMVSDEYHVKDFNYKDGDIFIDLGAHIGTWSVLMAMRNPTFKVYSYEPLPENFDILCKNILSNRLTNIKPFNLAVSGTSEGKENIYYTDDSTPFGATHKFIGSDGGSGKLIKIDRISLNDILSNLSKVRVIKSDCEGCECRGFRVITDENLDKIDYVIGEFHGRGMTEEQFFSFFKNKFTNLSRLRQKTPKWGHFLYRNKEKHLKDCYDLHKLESGI